VSDQGPPNPPAPSAAEPTLARAQPATWRAFAAYLLHAGRQRLVEVGLVLVAGFVAALLCIVLFAKLASEVVEQETMQLDLAVLLWLRQFRSPALDLAMQGISLLGSQVLAVFWLLLLVVFGRQRRWGTVAALLLIVIGAYLLNSAMKEVFERTRPTPIFSLDPAQTWSFPSGHASVSAAFYSFLAYLSWRLLHGVRHLLWTAALLVVVVLIGLSRLYLGVHYLTDVVAGYLAGFVWTDAVIIGGRILGRVRAPRPTDSPAANQPPAAPVAQARAPSLPGRPR
jgi:undecaprenyl-diphosphatase